MFFKNAISVPVFLRNIPFFFTGIQICQVNLSMLVSTPRETFRKRERERERVRLNVQVAEMFFISLEQIFIQYVDRSNFSRLVGFEGWAYIYESLHVHVDRSRIANHLASNIRVTSSTSSHVRQKIVMQSEKRALDSHTYARIRENWRGILVQG